MGWLAIKTGKYWLDSRIYFHVSGNASGMVLVLHDLDRHVAYSAHLHDGKVDHANVRSFGDDSARVQHQAEPTTVSGPFDAAPTPSGYLQPSGVVFRVTFPGTPLPDRKLQVLGGYERLGAVRIVYRSVLANVFRDEVGALRAKEKIVLNLRGRPGCLLRADWLRFGALAPGATFKVGRHVWKKLNTETLQHLVGDKTLVAKL